MLSPGDSPARYRLVEQVGSSSKGDVWRAIDTDSNREVAMRRLPFANDPERLARCETEMKALIELDHPGIASVHGIETFDGAPFLVTEFVRGTPLERRIPGDGLPVGELLRLALPLTAAVRAAHERGVLHGDLKPANVIVDESGTLKVLDFGLRTMTAAEAQPGLDPEELPTETLTQDELGAETLPYCSPERVRFKALDGRADVYSLGAMLFEMSTGRAPFQGDSSADLIVAILRDAPSRATEVNPAVPPRLDGTIARALTKDRKRRLQSVQFLHDDLARLAEELSGGS